MKGDGTNYHRCGKRREWSQEEAKRVEELAPYLTQQQLAEVLHMSQPTFTKLYGPIYREQKAAKLSNVAENLYNIARGTSKQAVSAGIFLLKTQGGWRERNHLELSSGDGDGFKVNIMPARKPGESEETETEEDDE